MKTFLLSLILFSFLSNSDENGLKINDKAPNSTTEMLGVDNNKYTLENSVEENGLIVIFTCNTCPFVVGNENFAGWEVQYNAISKFAKENKIGLLFVNSNEAKRANDDSFEEMKKRAKEKAYQHPYVVDENHVIADAFGAKTTPHVFAFNNDLELVYKGSIDNSYDSKREKDEHYLNETIDFLSKRKNKLLNQETPPRGCSIKRVKK